MKGFRRFFAVVLAAAMWAAFAPAVPADSQAPLLYEESFDGYMPGSAFENGTDSWSVSKSASSNTTVTVQKDETCGLQYLNIEKKSSGVCSFTRDFSNEAGGVPRYRLTARIKSNHKSSSIAVISAVSCEFWYNSASGKYTMGVWNGSSNEAIQGLLVDLSEYRDIRFDVDSVDNTVDVYVDGVCVKENAPKKTTTVNAAYYKFRMEINNSCKNMTLNLDSVRVNEIISGNCDCSFDNAVSGDAGSLGTEFVNFTGGSFTAENGLFGKTPSDRSICLSGGEGLSVSSADWRSVSGRYVDYSFNMAFSGAEFPAGGGAVEIYPEKAAFSGSEISLPFVLSEDKWYNFRVIIVPDGSFELWCDGELCGGGNGLNVETLEFFCASGNIYLDDFSFHISVEMPEIKTAELQITDNELLRSKSGLVIFCPEDLSAGVLRGSVFAGDKRGMEVRTASGDSAAYETAAAGCYLVITEDNKDLFYVKLSETYDVYKSSGEGTFVPENGSVCETRHGIGQRPQSDISAVVTGKKTEKISFDIGCGLPLIFEASVLLQGEVSGAVTVKPYGGAEVKIAELAGGSIYAGENKTYAGVCRSGQWVRISAAFYSGGIADIFVNGTAAVQNISVPGAYGIESAAIEFKSETQMNGNRYGAFDDIHIYSGINAPEMVTVYPIMEDTVIDGLNQEIYYPVGPELSDCIAIGYDVRLAYLDENYIVLNCGSVYKYFALKNQRGGITLSLNGNAVYADASPKAAGAVMIMAAYDRSGKMLLLSDKGYITPPPEAAEVKAMYVRDMNGFAPVYPSKSIDAEDLQKF
ncbi:MAG: hypothetical protein J6N52_12365 [Clostridia bacterium]|nr:hypothetical protein [Clostridia bacterium]